MPSEGADLNVFLGCGFECLRRVQICMPSLRVCWLVGWLAGWQRLYGAGARKIVVFGVGPIHTSPFGLLLTSKMTPGDARMFNTEVDATIKQLNKELLDMVNKVNADNALGMAHESLQLVFADVYGAVTHITKSPSNYGKAHSLFPNPKF